MNVFRFEMKAYAKFTLTWTLALAVVCFLFLSLFTSYTANVEEATALLQGYSSGMLSAFGIDLNTFFGMVGFYSFLFIYIALCGGIQALHLGLAIISKEKRHKTSDFLLTKPITRQEVLTGKLLALYTSLLFTNIVYILVSIGAANLFSEKSFDTGTFTMMSLSLLFIQFVFAALGVLIGVVFNKIKSVTSISLSVVFAFFLIAMLQSMLHDHVFKYLTPFKYFDTSYIAQHGTFEFPLAIVAIVVFIASMVASYIIYIRKDVHTV